MNEPEVILTGDLDTVDGYRAEAEERILEALDEVCAPDIEDIDKETLKKVHQKTALKLAQALACIRGVHTALIDAQKAGAK
jgi:hypothetical protein